MLIAEIESSKFSYFIANHGARESPDVIDDEALIEMQARIIEIEPTQPDHIGKPIACTLLISRRFLGTASGNKVDKPLLYSVTLRKNQRSMLAYLPSDTFWACQPQIISGTLRRIEIRYAKPTRGTGELESLHVS